MLFKAFLKSFRVMQLYHPMDGWEMSLQSIKYSSTLENFRRNVNQKKS